MALVLAKEDKARARRLQRAATAGQLRRIYPGVYTDDLVQPLDSIVRRELLALCSMIIPATLSRIVQLWRGAALPLPVISSLQETIAETLTYQV